GQGHATSRPPSWSSSASGGTEAIRMRWLLLKDLRILSRSPLLVAMLVIYPIVIAALVGFAVTSGPDKPRVAVLNEVPASATQISLGGETVNVSKEAKPLFDALDPVYVQSRKGADAQGRRGRT